MKAQTFNDGALELIGNTPLVRLKRLSPNPKVEVWAKLECANPGGSVKDRVALSMINAAEASGDLTRDKVILEATSGNTGIGLALVGAIKGYRVMLAMSEAVSQERRQILSALGAEFLLTPAAQGTDGAIEVVYRQPRREPGKYYIPDQFNNPANPLAHYDGTALEVIQQTGGRITHFVSTMGTTGTLMGMSRRLREDVPGVRIIGVEPYLGHKIQGLKNLKEAYRPGIFDREMLDEKVNIADEDAYETSRLLAREEGLFVGMSSGAAAFVALQKAAEIDSGVIVVILPDGGERYLSTTLFQASVPVTREPSLELYNTLTRARMPFKPITAGQVGMYTCGPTVHTEPHIGLLRRVVATDLLRRYLEYSGLEVKHVMNITDIDDNTIAESGKQDVSLKDLTDRCTDEFMKSLDVLSVRRAWKYPRASEHMDDMVAVTRRLVDRGFAYEKLRSVYFDIAKFEGYGVLSSLDMGKIKIGATVDLDEYEKDNPRDFTLFKRATLGEMARDIFYETEWGNVRPGWHVECAAMSTRYLGDEFDIHTSGVDLVFPHSENEIAVCQAVSGKSPARFWFHSDLVFRDGKKMSRSAGNAVTLNDILGMGFTGRDARFLLMSTHYRQPLTYSEVKLEAARAALKRIDSFVCHLNKAAGNGDGKLVQKMASEMIAEFDAAMDADLNVPRALGAVFTLIRKMNPMLACGDVSKAAAETVLDALRRIDPVLAVFDFEAAGQESANPDIEALVQKRDEARERKDFEEADRIREELRARCVTLEDTADGTVFWVDESAKRDPGSSSG